MKGLLPNPITTQLVLISRPQRVTITTDVESWYAHYAGPRSGHVRCAGKLCSFCAQGTSPRKRRAFVLCIDRNNDERWISLGIDTRWLEDHETAIGLKIAIWKDGDHRNAKICGEIEGKDPNIEGKSAKAFFEKWDPMAPCVSIEKGGQA